MNASYKKALIESIRADRGLCRASKNQGAAAAATGMNRRFDNGSRWFRFPVAVFMMLSVFFVPAQAGETLDKILKTRQISLGHWPGEIPFSHVDAAGQPVGYSIDLCKRVVQDLSRRAGGELVVSWTAVDAKTRFSLMDDGRIDLLCADTTNTSERQKKYGFSHTIFVAGTRVLVPKGSAAASLGDLSRKKIGLIPATTGDALIRAASAERSLHLEAVAAKGLDDLFRLLEAGEVDAIGYDDVLLADKISRSKAGADGYRFLKEYFSIEPYGLMVRKNDSELLAAVNKTLGEIFVSGAILGIYDRWFVNAERKVPLGYILRDDFRNPNNHPAFP